MTRRRRAIRRLRSWSTAIAHGRGHGVGGQRRRQRRRRRWRQRRRLLLRARPVHVRQRIDRVRVPSVTVRLGVVVVGDARAGPLPLRVSVQQAVNVGRTAAVPYAFLFLEKSVHIVPACNLTVPSFTFAEIPRNACNCIMYQVKTRE